MCLHSRAEEEATKTNVVTAAPWYAKRNKLAAHGMGPASLIKHPPPARPRDALYDVTVGQQCWKQIVIHPRPINPHTDIAPTGRFEVMVRPVLRYSSGGETGPLITEDKACVYQPDGRCTHVMPVDTAVQLYQRFTYMQRHHAKVLSKLEAGTFEEEISKLMYRYTDGTVCSGKRAHAYKIAATHQRAMPTTLRTILHDILGSQKERFASPLDASPNCAEYWSVHRQDQAFGAHWDAYKTRWTGASTACPDLSEQQAEKVVLWALNSATDTHTTTTSNFLSRHNDPKVHEGSKGPPELL
jgi:hypothetical protein